MKHFALSQSLSVKEIQFHCAQYNENVDNLVAYQQALQYSSARQPSSSQKPGDHIITSQALYSERDCSSGVSSPCALSAAIHYTHCSCMSGVIT